MERFNLGPKFRWLCFYLVYTLLVFGIARLWMFSSNYEYFSALSIYEIFLAFIAGIKFDLSTILIFSGLPFFLMVIPIYKKAWYFLCASLNILMFIPILGLVLSNIAFFTESKYHMGNQALLIGNDIGFIIETALSQYFYFILFLIIAIAFLIRKMFTISKSHENYIPPSRFIAVPKVLFLAGFVFFGVSGKVGLNVRKMISTSDAFTKSSIEYGNLVLNGGFTTFQVIREKRWKNTTAFFDASKADDITRKLLETPSSSFVDSSYPTLRKIDEFSSYFPKDKKINVMFVLLESWSAEYIDFFSGKNSGNTKNFDKIASEGMSYTNFLPNGPMSLYGVTAALTSLPPSSRIPAIGKGLELYGTMRVGQIFRDLDYYTFAAQSAIRRSFRMNSIMSYLGFEDYYGKEDYPKRYEKECHTNGWDGEMYSFLNNKMKTIKTPFFGFAFTGTTHIPYLIPTKQFEKYPHNEKTMDGFSNSLYYADYELGEFMKKAKAMPWFDDTLFVFMADHTLHRVVYRKNNKIPLVLYSPKYLPAKKIDYLGSQVDVMPSLFQLLHIDTNYSGIGRSLLDKLDDRFVFAGQGNVIGLTTKDGYVQHNLKKVLESTISKDKEEDVVQKLLAIEQSLWQSIEKSKLHKK